MKRVDTKTKNKENSLGIIILQKEIFTFSTFTSPCFYPLPLLYLCLDYRPRLIVANCNGRFCKEGEILMFCPQCGNRLPEDAVFCNRCGTRVSNPNPDIGGQSPPDRVTKQFDDNTPLPDAQESQLQPTVQALPPPIPPVANWSRSQTVLPESQFSSSSDVHWSQSQPPLILPGY